MGVLRFILLIPIHLIRFFGKLIFWIFKAFLFVLRPIIGKIEWSIPSWVEPAKKLLDKLSDFIKKYVLWIWLFIIIIIVSMAGFKYYETWKNNQPTPIDIAPIEYIDVSAKLYAPAKRDYNYQNDNASRYTFSIIFSDSVAPVEKRSNITEGISISPSVQGEWNWDNDRILRFTPLNMWDIGRTYKVTIDPDKLLSEQTILENKNYSFTMGDFSYSISKSELYQNPLDPNDKNAIFEVRFSDPVDPATFEKNIKMKLVENIPSDTPSKDYKAVLKRVEANAKPFNFIVKYDDKKLNAWIRSEQVSLPEEASSMVLDIDKGVASSLGGNKTDVATQKKQYIASVYTNIYKNAFLTIAQKEDGMLQQALVVELIDGVNVNDFSKGVKAWVLPKNYPAIGNRSEIKNYRWGVDSVNHDILSKSKPLALTLDSSESENQHIISFKYKSEPNDYIYVEMGKNVKTVGGYKARYEYKDVLLVPDYPKSLNFLSQGSLLSLKGDKKIPLVSRNIEGISLDIRRVVPGQIQHLITMNDNWRFSDMKFGYINENHFIERFTINKKINVKDPGENNYEGIDISQYLYTKNGAKQGIFLVSLSSWDPTENVILDYGYGGYRLLVVTDIGIISKVSIDGSSDIFTQSITTGKPIGNAKVSVIGMNGIAVATAYTDENGHAKFKNLNNFRQEKTPVAYIVEKDGDLSFLPVSNYSYDRRLDFSRFNISGAINIEKAGKLKGYLFSDRGLYRPGDEVKIGTIVRAENWGISVEGIPVVAKIYDSRGQMVKEMPFTLDKSGFNEIAFATSESSPTGSWQIDLNIAKNYNDEKNENYKNINLGTLYVNIREFEPDRMNVKIDLTPKDIVGWVKPEELNASVVVENLFGTPAQDRRVSTKLFLTPTYFKFKNYSSYNFYDARYMKKSRFEMVLEDVNTNENGIAKLNLLLQEHERASYMLDIVTEAFEAGAGRSVGAKASVIVSPNEYLVGANSDGDLGYIKKDTQRNLNFISIDSKLNKIPLGNLTLEIVEQKYISVLTLQNSGVYKYQSKLKEVPISSDSFSINENGTKFNINTKTPGIYMLVVKNSIGDILYKTNYHVVGEANVERSLEKDAELGLKISKASYKVGDEVEIAIDTPYIGSGLITIEKDRVYAWKWFTTNTTSSTQTIKIPNDIKGNGYINVQFVRDVNSDEIFMSPLSYGVIPFKVENTKESTKVELISSKLVKPGEDINMTIKTAQKQKVVVFAVDEGILQVANYKLNNPLNYFFRKRELGVSSYQILDLILPEFNKIMKLTSAAGGDGELMSSDLDSNTHLNPFKRKIDKPVTYWSGIVEVDGVKTFSYKVPDYFNGQLRVMAVAVSDDKIGIAETNSVVRDDFILTPNVPYMSSPNDEFEVSVGVSNNLENLNGKAIPIEVSLVTSGQVKLLSNATHVISLKEKQEGFVKFKLKSTDMLGNAEFIFRASYEDKSSKTEFKTQRIATSSVRPLVLFRVESDIGRMGEQTQSFENKRDMYEAFALREAKAAHSPFIVSTGLASYLNNYPHLCSEQLVSRAISSMINDKYKDIMINSKSSGISHDNILSTLKTRQNAQGSIGMWRANMYDNIFVSVYSAHYMLEAKDNNITVPNSILRDLNTYLTEYASSFDDDSLYDLRMRAYTAYILTRQGVVTTNILSSIQDTLEKRYKESWRDDIVAVYLASTYKMLKMDKEADAILESYWKNLRAAYSDAWWSNHYYDPLVVNASAIYFISKHFPEKVKNIPAQALENMMLMVRAKKFTTTSSSMSILAIDSYTNALNEQAAKMDLNLTISAFSKNIDNASKDSELVQRLISQKGALMAMGNFTNDDVKVTFDNPSKLPTWYSVVNEGYDKLPPKESIKKGLEIFREYTDELGNPISSVKLGEKINVTIRVRSNSAEGVGNVAVIDLLPGGFEVVYKDTSKNYDDGDYEDGTDDFYYESPISISGTTWDIDYNDVREDRVLVYGYVKNDISTFKYQIKSTNIGSYQIAPIYAEAMYDREIQALSGSQGNITVLPAE